MWQYHELGHDGRTHFKIPIFARKEFGAPWLLNHRVDLHNELRRLATTEDGPGKPAVIRTASRVADVVSLEFDAYLSISSPSVAGANQNLLNRMRRLVR